MYNRYNDIEKFITDINELKMENGIVYISDEKDYDIAVVLSTQTERFEELKPTIVEVAKHVSELDNIVQKYHRISYNNADLEDSLELIYIDEPGIIIFEYFGAWENTQYTVVFEQNGDEFILKSFGLNKDIPVAWDK